jgi:DICT domain-containing protein
MESPSLYQTVLREAITWPMQMLQTHTHGSLRFESRVPEMAAWCRHLEEVMLRQPGHLRIFVGLERASDLMPAVAQRYQALAQQGHEVRLFTVADDPDVHVQYPLLSFILLPPSHPLAGEWFIVVEGDQFHALFTAREKHRWPSQRTFVGIISEQSLLGTTAA